MKTLRKSYTKKLFGLTLLWLPEDGRQLPIMAEALIYGALFGLTETRSRSYLERPLLEITGSFYKLGVLCWCPYRRDHIILGS